MNEDVNPILQQAERDAAAIRSAAERDAEDIRREAVAAAQRLLDRLQALEFPLGVLVAELQEETEEVGRRLEGTAGVPDSGSGRSAAREDSDAPAPAGHHEPQAGHQRPAPAGQGAEGWQRWVASDKN